MGLAARPSGRKIALCSVTALHVSVALPFVMPSISTCLRQVEGEMTSVHEVVIIAITPNGSATFTSRVQSRRDDLKVAQDVSPGLELEEKGSPYGTGRIARECSQD